MTEQFYVECRCHQQIRVELFEAGTQKSCPACQAIVEIPSTTRLKELSGDKYPLLSPLEKILHAAEVHESPFDGTCHGCHDAVATTQVPVTLKALVERHVFDDGGIRPTITGFKLVAGAAEEEWRVATFPLLLCEQCFAEFQSSHSYSRLKNKLKTIGLMLLLAAFLYFAYYNFEAVAAMAGLLWLVGAVAWALQFRNTKNIAPFILRWLHGIRWFPEAIATEVEYNLTVGAPSRIDAPAE